MVNLSQTIVNIALTVGLTTGPINVSNVKDNVRTKKILIASVPDFINAKVYDNSISKLMSSDDKKITLLMLLKYLMLTSKEANAMEKEVMDKIKKGLIAKEENYD